MYAYSVTKQTAGAMAAAATRHNEKQNKWRGLLQLIKTTFEAAPNFSQTVDVMQGTTKTGRHWRIWLTRAGAFVNVQLFVDAAKLTDRFYSDTFPVAMLGGAWDVDEYKFFEWAQRVSVQLDRAVR